MSLGDTIHRSIMSSSVNKVGEGDICWHTTILDETNLVAAFSTLQQNVNVQLVQENLRESSQT